MTTLLVNTGKLEALAELRRVCDDDIVVITEPQYVANYEASDKVELVGDVNDFSAVRRVAMRVAARGDLRAAVAPTDRSQLSAAYLRSVFDLPGVSFDTANAFTNKLVQKRRLEADGLPVARYVRVVVPSDILVAERVLGLPYILKPSFGAGTIGVVLVRDRIGLGMARDMVSALELERGTLLAEEYVSPIEEYICDGVVIDGKLRADVISKYHAPLLMRGPDPVGAGTVHPNSEAAAITRRLCQDAVRTLGLRTGVVHLEVLRGTGGYAIGEIACRPGGVGVPRNAAISSSVDLWGAFVASCVGGDVEPWITEASLPDRRYLWTALPGTPGQVEHICTTKLAALSYVSGVHTKYAVGDRIPDVSHTGAAAAIVYWSVAFDDLQDDDATRVREIVDCFELDVRH